jgi:PAS domain S-box-containing protein
MDKSLATEQNRMRSIIDSALSFAIIATDRDGVVTDWNSGAQRVLGWTARDMLGQSIRRIFTPEDQGRDQLQNEMAIATERGRAVNEGWRMRADGSRFWASGELTPLRDDTGGHIGFVKIVRDATAEITAQRELAAEREKLAQMFEQAPTFMAILRGPEHRFERVNPGYERLVGHRNLVGRMVAEALPDAVEQGFLTLLDTVFRTGEPFSAQGYRYAVQAVRGGEVDERHVDFVYQPLRDSEGVITGIFIEGADVTDRTGAEKALRESEALYRSLFDAIDEGFCIIEFFDGPHGPLSDYIHVQANEAYARHAGIPNVVGQKLREMVGSEADDWVRRYGGVLQTGEQIRFERELEATGRYLELAAVRIEPPSRKQVAVFFQDITARKAAEQGLRASEAQFRAFAQAVPNHVWASGPDGRLYWFNDRVYAYTGERAGGLDGSNWTRIVHPDDRADADTAWLRSLEAGTVYENEFRIRANDGNYRWFLVRAEPVLNPDGTISSWIGTNTDIENTRAQAAELANLNVTLEEKVELRTSELMAIEETLRQSQKMEAVGQLTGGLAHDFNNILAGIGGSLEIMSTRLAQGRMGDLDRYISGASTAVKRAAGLTQRLLAFSRRQTLDPRPTDLNALIDGMRDLIGRSMGPAVELETAGAAGLWTTFVDAGQLENALLNLCLNARDAMPHGGKVTIETGNRWMDERAGLQRGLEPGQYVSLCVSDTGTGMSADVIARAFDPFFTTKPIGQGTGLGLSMVYGFAGQSGGSVRIYSEIDKGTMICIYLPRHVGDEQPDELAPSLSEAPRAHGGELILLVDDEPLIRMVAAEQLEELGYSVIEASDAQSALKILNSPRVINLLITDVGLPGGMNGRQLADAARDTRPGLEVLFITGYAENAVLNHGHLEQGMHVLTKPFQMDTFARRVKGLISKSQ